MSVLPAEDALVPEAGEDDVLVPYWLPASARAELGLVVRTALTAGGLAPEVTARLEAVLTELHVAAARDLVWPDPAARVRAATGWAADVLPVRLSPGELAGLLGVPSLPARLRAALLGAAV